MAQLRIAYTRLRVEEKLLFEAATRLGIPVAADDVEDRSWPGIEADPGDVVLCRCIGQTHNIALAQLLESRGIRTINCSSVIALCGDKVTTAAVLSRAGVPQPEYMVAFSPEGAVEAAEKMAAQGISAEVIEALGPSGLLVNVARGQLVDEDAVIAALNSLEAQAKIRGSALGSGFAYPVTVETAARWTAGLEQRGLQLAPASAMTMRPGR